MPLPQTRNEAILLFQMLGWNADELGPDERQAIRDLYHLDDDRPLVEVLRDSGISAGFNAITAERMSRKISSGGE